MRHRFRSAARSALLAAFLALPSVAARADGPDPRGAQALDLFEQSEAAYDSGRFADAIALLRRSYELRREPVLLYNLGRAYEGLGDLPNAAQSYEAFLASQPNASDRGALQRRIATLRQQLAEREALRRQVEGRRPRGPSALPWLLAGIGAAGLVTGGAFGLAANHTHAQATNEPTYAKAADLQSEARSFATVANVCFVAGGALLLAGVAWGLLDASAAARSRGAPSAGAWQRPQLGSFVF
jgi:tetratricopeptide (TPR) repeat protein